MSINVQAECSTVDGERLAHGALHVQPLDVVPVLLEQGDEEVDGHERVLPQLIWGHIDMSNCHSQAQNLLQLELDVAANLCNLVLKVIICCQERWEFTGLVQARAQKT